MRRRVLRHTRPVRAAAVSAHADTIREALRWARDATDDPQHHDALAALDALEAELAQWKNVAQFNANQSVAACAELARKTETLREKLAGTDEWVQRVSE